MSLPASDSPSLLYITTRTTTSSTSNKRILIVILTVTDGVSAQCMIIINSNSNIDPHSVSVTDWVGVTE